LDSPAWQIPERFFAGIIGTCRAGSFFSFFVVVVNEPDFFPIRGEPDQ